MSAFVERIWQPSAKDVAAQLAPQSLLKRATVSGASSPQQADLSSIFAIPPDFVLILGQVSLLATAGAAQTATALEIDVIDLTASAAIATLAFVNAATQVAFDSKELAGCVVLNHQQTIRGTVIYSAAANPNTTRLSVNGILIPRGNWQFT